MYHRKSPSKGHFDKTLFWVVVLLAAFGILTVSNASAPQALAVFEDPYYFARQQVVWTVIGFVGLVVAANIHYSLWRKWAFAIGFGVGILLIVVLIPGIGSKLLGARRWLDLGPVGIQPSEIAKFGVALVVARLIDDKKYTLFRIIAVIGGACALVMIQPDLGTTIVIAAIGFGQLFVSGVSFAHLVTVGFGGLLATVFLIVISDYRRERLMTFLESGSDPLGKSYHVRQILIALGSGGIFGVGIGQSRQKHLFLPETASDSIFAVIAEETGLVGSLVVIGILTFFVMRVLRIVNNAPDKFSKVLGSGIAVWFMTQTFLNISSVVALTPLTGIPLPFFSYGGTSLVMILFAVGIILNISKFATHD